MCSGIKDKIPTSKRKGVVYSIECSDYSAVYIGETGRTLEDRLKEHQWHTRLGAVEKSAVAEHALLLSHEIDWKNAKVIDFASGVSQRIKENCTLKQPRTRDS